MANFICCVAKTQILWVFRQFPKEDKNKLDFKASHSRVLTENPSLIILHPAIFTR